MAYCARRRNSLGSSRVQRGVVSVGMLVGAVTVLVGTPAHAGGDEKTFKARGIGITFEYPASFTSTSKVTFQKSAGSEAVARGAVALDKVNLIIVSRYNLRVPVTAKNLPRFKGEVDSVIGKLAGKPVSGRRVERGGLTGYAYVISLSSPAKAVSRMSVLFAGPVEYLINCQSTPAKRAALDAGCRMALATLRRT
jgi:hypothetical protein